MRLIFTNSLPTSRIFGEKINPEWYRDNGLDVEFWDLSQIFLSKEKLDGFYSGASNYRYQGPNQTIFTDFSSFASAVENLINTPHLFWHISRFARMHDDDKVIELFNRNNSRYVFQHFDPHSVLNSATDYLKAPMRELRQYWHARNCYPIAVVTSGSLGRTQVRLRYPRAKIISIPSVKVLWSEPDKINESSGVVFVDESIAFDPDAQLHGRELCRDVGGYYRRMRDFFSLIEDTLGQPVKIACSGKFHYPDASEFFGFREIAYEQTLSLIQNCSLVIGHLSLALDQAIVSHKPVMLLDDPGFTTWRRKGFRDVISRFRQTPKSNDSVTAVDILAAMQQNMSFYSDVEHYYFREKGVRGDHREICLASFQELADV